MTAIQTGLKIEVSQINTVPSVNDQVSTQTPQSIAAPDGFTKSLHSTLAFVNNFHIPNLYFYDGKPAGKEGGKVVKETLLSRTPTTTQLPFKQGYIKDNELKAIEVFVENAKRDGLEIKSNNPDLIKLYEKIFTTSEAETALTKLQNFAQQMNDNDSLKGKNFIVETHTDPRGLEKDNKILSEKRGRAITLALELWGVESKRLKFDGKGEKDLLHSIETIVKVSGDKDNEVFKKERERVVFRPSEPKN